MRVYMLPNVLARRDLLLPWSPHAILPVVRGARTTVPVCPLRDELGSLRLHERRHSWVVSQTHVALLTIHTSTSYIRALTSMPTQHHSAARSGTQRHAAALSRPHRLDGRARRRHRRRPVGFVLVWCLWMGAGCGWVGEWRAAAFVSKELDGTDRCRRGTGRPEADYP